MSNSSSAPDTPAGAPPSSTPTDASTAPPPYDWTGNPLAKANRAEKIKKIVAWCQTNGYDPEVADPKTRRLIVREAGYSSASEETWTGAVTLYVKERDATWLERALARESDTPAARILARAAEQREARRALGSPGSSAT